MTYIIQMDQEGSLRNSHRETSAVRRKVAPKQIQAAARELVNRASQSGCIIRQRLDLERMKQPLQKGVFYVAENDGNAEPGFLVFLPFQAPVFLQMKQNAPPPCTLRMRVSPLLSEGGGSVFVATLDSVQHILRIEDVWMWKGSPIFDTEGYSSRRQKLLEFVERYWIPDARLLGGIRTTILNPKSLERALSAAFTGVHTIDLIPEMAGKRRMWMLVDDTPVKKANTPVQAQPVTQPSKEVVRKVRAVPIPDMPDIYNLYDENGFPISRASVQIFSLSQELRVECKSEGMWVIVKWRPEFGGYEIIKKAI